MVKILDNSRRVLDPKAQEARFVGVATEEQDYVIRLKSGKMTASREISGFDILEQETGTVAPATCRRLGGGMNEDKTQDLLDVEQPKDGYSETDDDDETLHTAIESQSEETNPSKTSPSDPESTE